MNEYYSPAKAYAQNYHGALLSSTRNAYYTRHLLQKAMSVFKFTIPERWDMNYFLFTLFTRGYVCVTDVGMPYGVIPQHCTISGWNIYYNPAKATIANPLLQGAIEVDLGIDGELIALTPDYHGILDCVNEYSEMMANATAAINMNLYNSRHSVVYWAGSKAQAETLKKMYDMVGAAEPAVFLDKGLLRKDDNGNRIQPWEPFNARLKENYITDKALDDLVKIEQSFAKKVGLPQANTLKRERMNVDEVNKGDVDTRSNTALWLEMLKLTIDRTNKMFPELKLGVELRYESELSNDVPLSSSETPTRYTPSDNS